MADSTPGPVLGIWDGHDAGAALVQGSRVLFAVNEERLSRRKLDAGFPHKSVAMILERGGVAASEIQDVAFTTSDFAKTLTRAMPSLKEGYYQLRRKKVAPGPLYGIKKAAKYVLTEIPASWPTRALSRRLVARDLGRLGLGHARLHLVDHHSAHAASAWFAPFAAGAGRASGVEPALVLTIDGIGDALSGSLWKLTGHGALERLETLDASASLGLFFEHVTNLMNMRELEDEGKVMALANYAFPVPDEDNPMLAMFRVEGTRLVASSSSRSMARALKEIHWRFPAEQFAYMAQRTLELRVVELVRNALRATGCRRLAYSGGVASNIRVNLLLREIEELDELFVFPHMGDGGQALGAAAWINFELHGTHSYPLDDIYWGPEYSDVEIEQALGASGYAHQRVANPARAAAERIAAGEVIFWFQGRMEYGPRALGARSILARADSGEIRDRLNLALKKRVWYQPFCPSMLENEARRLLIDGAIPNRYMTCGYRVRPEAQAALAGVMSVDGTCRPQILPDDDASPYAQLLREMSARIGSGVLLNTSLNTHGEPLVCSPEDVLRTFARTGVDTLVIGNWIVSKKAGATST